MLRYPYRRVRQSTYVHSTRRSTRHDDDRPSWTDVSEVDEAEVDSRTGRRTGHEPSPTRTVGTMTLIPDDPSARDDDHDTRHVSIIKFYPEARLPGRRRRRRRRSVKIQVQRPLITGRHQTQTRSITRARPINYRPIVRPGFSDDDDDFTSRHSVTTNTTTQPRQRQPTINRYETPETVLDFDWDIDYHLPTVEQWNWTMNWLDITDAVKECRESEEIEKETKTRYGKPVTILKTKVKTLEKEALAAFYNAGSGEGTLEPLEKLKDTDTDDDHTLWNTDP